jgi:cobalt-zinc-cadmium efflux system protein
MLGWALALMAIEVGRKSADDNQMFGYRRFEILAAACNAVLLFAIAICVLVGAINRFNSPGEVQSWGTMIIAAIGLAVPRFDAPADSRQRRQLQCEGCLSGGLG